MSRTRSMARRRWLGVLGGLLVSAMVMSTWGSQPAGAADESRLNAGIGFPEWAGSDQPVPELPVPHTVDNQLQAIFDADLAAGAGSGPGTDFWIDKMLARHGNAGGNGDSNNWLFTRGRAAYMYNHQPRTIGFGGSAAYWHELNVGSIYAISLDVDGTEVVMTEDVAARKQTPSYWTSTFVNEDVGLRLVQTKFITHNNVAVTNLSLSSTDGAAKSVRLTAVSPLAGTADGDELTGIRTTRNNIATLYPRLSADGFAPESGKLVREVGVPAGGSVDLKVQLGFVTQEIAKSATEYEQYRALSPAAAYSKHVTAYNRWWAENVPYLDTPEDNIDKTLFYRWWLMRFNFLDADVPGNDYQFPTSMEGVTGYNNAIVLTAGMFIDDLKYFRDPAYSYGPWVSAGETARSGKMVDNPGSPSNWSNSYTEYITEAGWRSYQLHGGPAAIARNLATYGENDVRGLLDAYDSNGNNLIEYDWGAMTGNDADAVSFDWAREHGHTNMDRAENAYLYSNAMASAQAYRASGDDAKADEVEDLANTIKAAVMETLWNEEDNLIEHRQAGGDRLLVDWKEINNYYPFSVGLVPKPGEGDYDDDYVEALRLWKYADEYPIFPFYTANQVDAAERGGGGSNNFSIINSTVTFRMLSRVLRDYPNQYVGNDYYKKLLYWNAWAHYINGDNRLPDQNEFWNTGTANTEWGDTQGIGYRSWIHHTILGTTNFTMIEDAMGLRPRSDGKLELDPIDIDWPHFMANNIRYRNMDLTIVWDDPADGERHYGKRVPEGYSAFLDGKLAFTADSLGRVVYDPASGDIVAKDAGVEVVKVHQHKKAQQPTQVRFPDDARVVDLFAKAGADIATATTRVDNLAEGADATATYVSDAGYSSPQAAVDGTTINEPFWGTVGSPNERDSLEVDLGASRKFDEVRLYFYRTSSSDAPQGGRLAGTRQGYAAPSMYSVEYFDGSTWRTVRSQAKSPVYPRGNYNLVQFPHVDGSKVRVTVTHAPGFRTGVKEIQVRRTGIDAPPVSNAPPRVSARVDTSYAKAGLARLIGTVLDDALPEGRLSAQWSVVSAPDGATALFEDPAAATTLVRFSQPGSYTLRLTADDGALTESFDLVVEGTAASEGGNVAPAAQPSASYTAGWNDVNAVNNGTGQNSGGQQSQVWGTWSGDRPPTQWLQYTWDDPVRVASSEIMFWTDAAAGSGQGVAVPASWSMQYRDPSTGEWVDVPNADGYGTERTGTNTTRFDAVTTTALRANFNASPNAAGTSYSAIGVAEWQVFSEAPESVVDIDVRTLVGEVPTLPEQVGVVYSDGSRGTASVAWPQITEEQVASDGDFTVHGIVDGTPQMVAATVWVRSGPPGQINTIDPVAVHTPVGVAPQLPDKATVQYNDGSREMLPVTWDPIDPASYSDHNTFAVEGAVEGPGTTTATATVVVGNGSPNGP